MVKKRKNKINENPLWATIIIYAILVILSVVTIYPILNMFAKSFSEAHVIAGHPLMLVPMSFTTAAYEYIFSTSALTNSFLLTVGITLVGTVLNLILVMTASYGLSKPKMPGYSFFRYFIIIPMLINAGLIPTYMLIRSIGLLNNPMVLVVVGLVSPYNLLLVRNYIMSAIPDSLEEAAFIEGANEFQILARIIVPLSKPILATIGLFVAVGYWNDMFTALFYINDNKFWPLQLMLRSIIISQDMASMGSYMTTNNSGKVVVTPDNIKAAAIIFTIVPIIMVYPFVQKHFVKGIMLGAVKG